MAEEPHDLEVYANVAVPGGDFPGDDAILRFSEQSCVARFEDYVGVPLRDSMFDYFSYVPSESSWGNGDQIVTCRVVDPDGGKLTSSARGAGA